MRRGRAAEINVDRFSSSCPQGELGADKELDDDFAPIPASGDLIDANEASQTALRAGEDIHTSEQE